MLLLRDIPPKHMQCTSMKSDCPFTTWRQSTSNIKCKVTQPTELIKSVPSKEGTLLPSKLRSLKIYYPIHKGVCALSPMQTVFPNGKFINNKILNKKFISKLTGPLKVEQWGRRGSSPHDTHTHLPCPQHLRGIMHLVQQRLPWLSSHWAGHEAPRSSMMTFRQPSLSKLITHFGIFFTSFYIFLNFTLAPSWHEWRCCPVVALAGVQ